MACVAWSSLPADLLQDISSRLSSNADHLHIHQVCTHWRASTSSPAAFRPWILAGGAGAYSNGLLAPFSDYSLRLPRPAAQSMELGNTPAGLPYCCGASFGWLALVDDKRSPTRLVLWEPLSNAEVPLPCLSQLSRVFISGDPLTSSSWVAIATQCKGRVGQMRTVLVLRPGEAACSWTMLHEYSAYEIEASTCTFHGGKAYYMDGDIIVICDLDTSTRLPPRWTHIYQVYDAAQKLCRCGDGMIHPVRGVHLVACNGDLLLVVLRFGEFLSHPSWAQVYKPEWTSETYPRVELRERVMDLGDYSLFLGVRGHTFALSAKEFPAIKRNCIYYYADEHYYNSCWISAFSLESGALEEIPYLEELKQGQAQWTPYAWFCPRAPFLKQQRP